MVLKHIERNLIEQFYVQTDPGREPCQEQQQQKKTAH